MRTIDALNIFELNIETNIKEIKNRYKDLCKKYHPDLNPAGLEMMKLVNAAMEALEDFNPEFVHNKDQAQSSYGAEIWSALQTAHSLNLDVEVTGAWLWLHGDTKPVKDQLKQAGFFWSPKKRLWYFRPKAYKSRSRGKFTMEDIRIKYGSTYHHPKNKDVLLEK